MTLRFTRRRRRLRLGAGLVLATAFLSACAPIIIGGAVVGGAMVATDRRTAGSQVDDETIQVKASGRMEETFPDNRINTTSYNRMVLLTGEVATEADKLTAEQVVARIPTVQSVVNELTVGQPNTFREKSNDFYIATKVKATLIDDKELLSNSIKAVTHRGIVYLMGRVTEREATRATELVRGISGVAKVVRVFEILTEAEVASTQPKPLSPPASAASSAPVRP